MYTSSVRPTTISQEPLSAKLHIGSPWTREIIIYSLDNQRQMTKMAATPAFLNTISILYARITRRIILKINSQVKQTQFLKLS